MLFTYLLSLASDKIRVTPSTFSVLYFTMCLSYLMELQQRLSQGLRDVVKD